MITLTPKIQEIRGKIWLYVRRYSRINGKQKEELLKMGESVIIEGGVSTGKTHFLTEACQKLQQKNVSVIYIKGGLPIGDWVKDYKLFGKNLEKRIAFFLASVPQDYYLVIDDTEKIQDSRKLEVIMSLMQNARSVIIGCVRVTMLHPKIKSRLKDCKVFSLGAGGETFDITYFVIALLIVFIAIVGAVNLVFLAAAMRYLFMGSRIGGKKV